MPDTDFEPVHPDPVTADPATADPLKTDPAKPESAETADQQALTFDNDKGASRSTWIAALLLLALIGWMGSGYILPAEEDDKPAPVAKDAEPVAVAVQGSRAKTVTLYFQAEGQAQPDRETAIRAETAGDVAEVLVKKGEDVSEGQVIARLSKNSAQADLNRAQEERSRAQLSYDNAQELLRRGVGTRDRVSQAQAALAAANAAVTTAEEALDSTNIVAPFAGRIETLTLDAGEYISPGSDVGRIVDNRPLTVALQVPQQALGRIRNGQTAQVSFITGETREGRVTFVGTSAASETRTFLAEVEVANENGAIPAGISADIRIPTGEKLAHFISTSVVSLSPEGETGVKVVEDGMVVFYPIDVVRAEVDGIWVTGLPDEAQIITIGQGFVRNGETVNARPETDAADGVKQADAPPANLEPADSGPPEAEATKTEAPSSGPMDSVPAERLQ